MWYLPIGDRLMRMYQNHKTAAAMRWHAEHQSKEGEMNHPSDAVEWRYFQELHPLFTKEPRNVYLGPMDLNHLACREIIRCGL